MTQIHTPYSEDIWDEKEVWPRERIEEYQLEALRKQFIYLEENSVFYQNKFKEVGFSARDFTKLEDIRQLPITYKADYVAALEKNPPLGTMVAAPIKDLVRVHFSSGTTGKPTPVYWSKDDIERWSDLYARYFYAQGLRRDDTFQCLFSYAWFVGGLGATLAAQRVGALVIPGSSGDTERQINTIFDFGTDCVMGTPSFMAHIAEAALQMGLDLRDSNVRMVCVGGEPGASIPGTRARIEAQWGAKMFDCYGALESQPIGWESVGQTGPILAEDFIYVEVLDAQTLEPVEDGQKGVLVLTHLDKQACPLVRWWTGDIVVRDSSVGADGRTHARLTGGVLGRADDMLVIRGVNVFPSAIENIVRKFKGTTNEYQIVIDESLKDPSTGFLNGVRLRVEPTPEAPSNLAEQLADELRQKLQARFYVELTEAGSLPKSVHKAKRVIYE